MTKTFTKTQTLDVTGVEGLDKVKVVVPTVGEYNIDLDFNVPEDSFGEIEVAMSRFQIVAFVAHVTPNVGGDVSLLTNDLVDPDDTFDLRTTDPLFWDTTTPAIFTVDVAKLIVKNDGTFAVNVKARALLTATD